MVKVGISFYVDKSICCFQAQELSMYFGNQQCMGIEIELHFDKSSLSGNRVSCQTLCLFFLKKLNSCHKWPLCIGDRLIELGKDEREGDGTGEETGVDADTDCGVVGGEGVALDVTGVGDEGSAVKLKSFTVVTFSVCTECCSLSLRDGKCSKRIFLAADGLILGEALRFFNMD
jgi:hypothetical protein